MTITNFSVKTDTPISIASSRYESEDKAYYCNHCQRILEIINPKTKEYMCLSCAISYYPEHQELRSKSKLSVPDGPVESPCVSYTPELRIGKPKVEIKGTFKALQDKGIRIKDYREEKGK